MPSSVSSKVSAENEWSPLSSVIVGRAEHSCFPAEPKHMIEATMPAEYSSNFRSHHPFPPHILSKAQKELDNLALILKEEGIQVHRPTKVDWMKFGGYTGAMPRDGLITVGNTIVEACFAWGCRRHEVQFAFGNLLQKLEEEESVKVVRAPMHFQDTIYDQVEANSEDHGGPWAINNTRPAFDAADFMRFGKVIIGQLSNVTNMKGVEYLRAVIPAGYSVELLDTDDPHAMHIDATILPLRNRLLIYHPERVTETSLRAHRVFRDWELHPYPFPVEHRSDPPLFMTSAWLVLNALSIDENRVLVEAKDTRFAAWIEEKFGIEAIMCPFQHVNSIGGSFHCATVDLVRG